MFSPADTSPAPAQLRITLDGQPIELAPQLQASLPAIRAHLEARALSRQRILHVLVVDGVTLNLQKPAWPFETFHHVAAVTISFDELTFQLLRLAREQVAQLTARAEAAVPLVLINEWPAVQRIWWHLLPDLKEPLVTLSFLPGRGLPPASPSTAPAKACARQAEELGHIQQEIEAHLGRGDALAISDTLEKRLLPWLGQLGAMLERLHEVPQT